MLKAYLCYTRKTVGLYGIPKATVEFRFLQAFIKAAGTLIVVDEKWTGGNTATRVAEILVQDYNKSYIADPVWDNSAVNKDGTVSRFNRAYSAAIRDTAIACPNCSIESQVFVLMANAMWKSDGTLFREDA